VLVLEAGVSDEGVLNIQIPLLGPTLTPNTALDWNYTTTSQSGFNGRSISYQRGHVLGGSSTISVYSRDLFVYLLTPDLLDFMVYNAGSKDDFDNIAKVSGDSGWSWNAMQKFISRNARWSGSTTESAPVSRSSYSCLDCAYYMP
jgi:choline dehydrogenase-like flavoprotein